MVLSEMVENACNSRGDLQENIQFSQQKLGLDLPSPPSSQGQTDYCKQVARNLRKLHEFYATLFTYMFYSKIRRLSVFQILSRRHQECY